MSKIRLQCLLPRAKSVSAAVLAAGLLAAAGPAVSSDYYHVCRSVDGQYMMNDEALQKTGPNGDGVGPSISYKTRKTVILSQRRGYCIGSNSGNRFNFEGRTYVKDISFWDGTRQNTMTMLCELAGDGTPAGENCAREVVTMNWAITPQTPAGGGGVRSQGSQGPLPSGSGNSGGTMWMHNGSVMRLTAEGDMRRIVYEVPRPGLRKRGVPAGELLFEGRRDGSAYFGTAYVFTANCGKQPYEVDGSVQRGESRIVMTGEAPKFNRACQRVGSKPDRLVFTLRR